MAQSDYGNWLYQESLDGYGHPVRHVWENEKVDGRLKVSLSEGMHIMRCERGEWLVTLSIGSGKDDKYWCFESEEEALSNVEDLLPD